jgi:hypothetical protein
MATEGKLMEPGLGTNPRSSGERCRRRVPTRSWTTPDAGCRERRGKERSRKVSQWHPAGIEPVADATDPYRTSRIPTPQGGWVGSASSREGMVLGPVSASAPPPPPAGEERGGAPSDRVTAGTEDTPLRCYSIRHPEPRPHIC